METSHEKRSFFDKHISIFLYFLTLYFAVFGVNTILQSNEPVDFISVLVAVPLLFYCAWKAYLAGRAYGNGQFRLGYTNQWSSLIIFLGYVGVGSWLQSEFFRVWPGLLSTMTSHLLVLSLASLVAWRGYQLAAINAETAANSLPTPGEGLLWGLGLAVVAGLIFFLLGMMFFSAFTG